VPLTDEEVAAGTVIADASPGRAATSAPH